MATGDVTGAKRPRYQANERFDSGDADAASQAPRTHDDALQRALLTTPRAAAGAVMPGLIFTGFSLTLNPTGPADGLVRIGTELGVAVDANGRTIVKPAGVTVDVTIPVGTYQVYVYYQEDPADTALRRFLTVSSPFTEYPLAISTTFQSAYGTHTRAGNNANTVKDDVVNGVTTALVCIGIVTNGAGACTMSGRPDNVAITTIPNGNDITNRISTVSAPTTPPTVNTRSGSPQTIHDVLVAALYTVGQTAWKGSAFLTPAAGNNFGAYNIPAGGVDAAYRGTIGWTTIGDGVTSIGDFNVSDYANCKLLLDAAIAALPAAGGVIHLKKDVQLSDFDGSTVTIPSGVNVEIRSDRPVEFIAGGTPTIIFAAAESFVCSSNSTLTLRGLYIRFTDNAAIITNSLGGGFKVYGCTCEKVAAADSGAAFQGVNVQNIHLQDVSFITEIDAGGTTGAMALRISGTCSQLLLERVYHTMAGDDHASILITDVREDVRFHDVTINAADATFTATALPYTVKLDTTDNTTDIANRVIDGLTFIGAHYRCFSPGAVGYLTVNNLYATGCKRGVNNHSTSTWSGYQRFTNCKFALDSVGVACILYATTNMGDLFFEKCEFRSTNTTSAFVGYFSGNGNHKIVSFNGCRFDGWTSTTSNILHTVLILCTSIAQALFDNNIITNWGNSAYAGSVSANTTASIFRVETGNGSKLIAARNNIVNNIMAGSTGDPRNQPYLLSTAGLAAGSCARVVVTGNEVGNAGNGGTSDCCGLWFNAEVGCLNWDVSGNHVYISWNDGVGGVTWLDGSVLRFTGTTTGLGTVYAAKFDGNTIHVLNYSSTHYTLNVIFLDNSGTAVMNNVSISGNNFFSDAGSKKFDFVTAWGIYIPTYTTTNLAVAGNNASGVDPGFLPDVWRINTAGGSITNAFNDVTPGAGVQVPGNNGLYGNA